MSIDKKFVDYIKDELKSKETSKIRQAIIYRYLGDDKKSIEIFRSIAVSEISLKSAIVLNLAKKDPEIARQYFEQAAENCHIPEERFKEWLKIKQFDEIAVGYLWSGYILLMLGRYGEAYDLLKQVPVYFNKEKLTGSGVWQVYEPKLVTALLPLCEYKLNPTEVYRVKARKGLEDYITSFGEPKFKLDGYLYYFHLKEMFPEVYSETITSVPVDETQKSIRDTDYEKSKVALVNYDMRGAVVVSDVNRYYLDVFGTNKDLVEYIDKVKGLGGYPLLSDLMDVYAIEDTAGFEAIPLIEECNRLLKTVQDPWLLEKTRAILEVAIKAREDGSSVILYYDPELDLSKF